MRAFRTARCGRCFSRSRIGDARWRQLVDRRFSRAGRGRVLLSQGQHAGLHQRGKGFFRAEVRVRQGRHRAAGRQQGSAQEPSEIHREAGADGAARQRYRGGQRPGRTGRGAGHLDRKEHVWPHLHGDGAHDLSGERRWHHRAGLAQGEGQGPRRGSAGGGEGAGLHAQRSAGHPRRAADGRAARQGDGRARSGPRLAAGKAVGGVRCRHAR